MPGAFAPEPEKKVKGKKGEEGDNVGERREEKEREKRREREREVKKREKKMEDAPGGK